MGVTFQIDQASVKRVQQALGDAQSKAPSVIKVALNRTATRARILLANQAKSQYTVKTTGFKEEMQIKNATNGNLVAEIRSSGRPLKIQSFKTSAPKSGVKAQVLVSSGLKPLIEDNRKAFKRGSLIAQRKTEASKPLRFFYGPSVPKMIESEKHVYGLKKEEINELLTKNVNQQIARILGG